jgi:hypothetical protein
MIKQIVLLAARPAMPRDAFIKGYEEVHAPLVVRRAPYLKGYRRSYLIPGSMVTLAHIEETAAAPDFDAVTELWHEDWDRLRQFERAFAENASNAAMTEDAAQLFEPSKIRSSVAEEYMTSSQVLAARPSGHRGPPAVMMLAMPRKKPGMSREAFIDYYENHHALLPQKYLVRNGRCLFAAYRRSYPLPRNPSQPAAADRPLTDTGLDVMTEISFWTEADYRTFQDICSDPKIASILAEDEERLVDRSALMMFLAQSHISAEFDSDTVHPHDVL